MATLGLTVTIARPLFRLDVRAEPVWTLEKRNPDLGWRRTERKKVQLFDWLISARYGPMTPNRMESSDLMTHCDWKFGSTSDGLLGLIEMRSGSDFRIMQFGKVFAQAGCGDDNVIVLAGG